MIWWSDLYILKYKQLCLHYALVVPNLWYVYYQWNVLTFQLIRQYLLFLLHKKTVSTALPFSYQVLLVNSYFSVFFSFWFGIHHHYFVHIAFMSSVSKFWSNVIQIKWDHSLTIRNGPKRYLIRKKFGSHCWVVYRQKLLTSIAQYCYKMFAFMHTVYRHLLLFWIQSPFPKQKNFVCTTVLEATPDSSGYLHSCFIHC